MSANTLRGPSSESRGRTGTVDFNQTYSTYTQCSLHIKSQGADIAQVIARHKSGLTDEEAKMHRDDAATCKLKQASVLSEVRSHSRLSHEPEHEPCRTALFGHSSLSADVLQAAHESICWPGGRGESCVQRDHCHYSVQVGLHTCKRCSEAVKPGLSGTADSGGPCEVWNSTVGCEDNGFLSPKAAPILL